MHGWREFSQSQKAPGDYFNLNANVRPSIKLIDKQNKHWLYVYMKIWKYSYQIFQQIIVKAVCTYSPKNKKYYRFTWNLLRVKLMMVSDIHWNISVWRCYHFSKNCEIIFHYWINYWIEYNKSKCIFTIFSLDKFWMNKEKLTRGGFEPATSGLTCRRSTNWAN